MNEDKKQERVIVEMTRIYYRSMLGLRLRELLQTQRLCAAISGGGSKSDLWRNLIWVS